MNKSEELCKLLGIKPYTRCVNDSDYYHYDCETKINNKKCIKCEKYISRESYPNLKRENNFLKLLKLMSDNFGLIKFNNKEETINSLINDLTQGMFPNLKYKAQVIEWEY